MDDKQRIALVETRTDTTVLEHLIRYQFCNHLGSASLELDNQGRIISYEEYAPYGNTVYQALRSQTETPKRYRYTGKERDEESGLYYHGARYYASWLGRWSSTDPIGLIDGENLYVFCRNSPIVYHDPKGMADQRKDEAPSKLPIATASAGLFGHFASILGESQTFTAMGRGLREARLALNIDEILAVSTGGSWSSANNKQFLDWMTNQFTKNAGIASHQIPARPQISLAEELAKGAKEFREAASQLMTRGFGEVKELEKITNDAVAALKNTNRSTRDLANAVNKSIRGRIARAASDETKIVARALREAGFDPRTLTAITQEAATNGAVAANVAKGEQAVGLLARAAPVVGRIARAAAPVAKVVGKIATPVAAIGAAVQFATAKTTADYVDASISATSTVLLAAPHPLAKAAGAGLATGQIIDHALNVSDYSSSAGVAVYEKLKEAGINDTASFVLVGIASVAAIPSSIGYGAAAKVASWFR